MNPNVIVEMKGVSKGFSGVRALKSVDFSLLKGEIHALLGENGAGKSTLIKILTGAISKDSGSISYFGSNLENLTPALSRKLGISAIYQELTLVNELTIYQNLFLGYEEGKILTDDASMIKKSQEIMNQLGIDIDVCLLVRDLTIAMRQMVEIARAMLFDIQVLIMDEPTSSISKKETEILFKKMKEISQKGISIIYISHRLEEIFKVCDRVTIMRDGNIIQTLNVSQINGEEELVNHMIGNRLDVLFPKHTAHKGKEIIRIENLSRAGVFSDVSFSVCQGEIFGIGGLVGSKRSEIVEAVFGLKAASSGKVFIEGKEVSIKTPADGIKNGMALLTEDRKKTGLFLQLTVRENISMPTIAPLGSKLNWVSLSKEKSEITSYIDRLHIKTPNMEQIIRNLSGGNQQKGLIARWILTHPKILMMDEPTRGIDVNAKAEIYALMNELVEKGITIIMVSSELPELLSMSDRIMVMREGHVAGFLDKKEEQTEENVLKLAFGGAVS